MMDNAPIDRATKIIDYLKKDNIQVLEWSPYSPDLNPIENMWWKLKNTILQVCPESETFRNSKEDQNIYEKASETAWKQIPSSCFEACVESMPRRVQAVIDAKGWYTKY